MEHMTSWSRWRRRRQQLRAEIAFAVDHPGTLSPQVATQWFGMINFTFLDIWVFVCVVSKPCACVFSVYFFNNNSFISFDGVLWFLCGPIPQAHYGENSISAAIPGRAHVRGGEHLP